MFKKLLAVTTALFLSMAGPVAAAPLIGGIGALVGGLSAGGLTLAGIATGLLSMGAQWLISKMLTPDQKQRGIKDRMETGGDNPPTFIVGEYATPGQLVYANTLDIGDNIPEQCLVYVIQLSCLPIDAVSTEVFVSNERCTIRTSETWNGFNPVAQYIKGGDDGGYLLMKFHHGDQNGADSWLMDKFGNDPDRPWKNSMFLPGCAYAIVQAWYSNRGIWTGMPTFRFVVRGAKVYDPRKDSTVPGGSGPQRRNNQNTWAFSKNPKVIQYNTHIGFRWNGDHVWGGQAEASRLPLEYWFAAMNACDENITKKNGDTINRYEMGAEISLDDRPIEIIREIDKSCDGFTTEYGGTYKTWAGGPGLAVGTITDDDFLITEDMESNLFQGRESTYNTVYASYPEPKQQWEAKDAPRYQNADALAEDGEELPLNLTLPFVSESNQVQRLGRSAIKDSRRQVTHGGALPPRAWVYEPYDLLNYQSETFGYGGSGKKFIIGSKDDLPNVNQIVLLREINPNDQGYVPADEQDWEAAPLVVLQPGTLALDVAAYADEVQSATGRDKPAIRAEWDWAGDDIDVRHIDWNIRRPGTTKVIASGKIKRVSDGQALIANSVLRFGKTYEIQFRADPFVIRESEWTAWKSVTCVDVEEPPAPTLNAVSDLGDDGKLDFFIDVSWAPVEQDATYEIRAVVGGKTLYYPSESPSLRIPVTSSKTYTISVRAIGADGTPGPWSDPAEITVTKKDTAPTTPSGLAANGGIQLVRLSWAKSPDKDYAETVIYRAEVNNFASAVEVGRKTGTRHVDSNLDNATTYYYWIAHVDRSGNESGKHPVSNTAGVSATTKLIDDDDTDDSVLAAPTALTLVKVQTADDDGTVRTFIKMTCTPPGWAGAKATYEWRVVVSGDDTYIVKSGDPKKRFHVQKTGVLHTVQVRCVKGTGNKSAWSSSAPITPTKKTAPPTTVTGLTVEARAKANVLTWTRSSDPDIKEYAIYRSTANNFGTSSEIGRTFATKYRDDDNLTKGTTYYYWVVPVNRSDASGSQSTGANGAFRGVEYEDADNVVLSAPTGISLTQANRDVDLDGSVDIALLGTFSGGVAGAIDYVFELSRSTSSGGTYTVIEERSSPAGKVWFKANTQFYYKMRVRAVAWDGTLGTPSSLTSAVQPAGVSAGPANAVHNTLTALPLGFEVSWAQPSELDYWYTEVAVGTISVPLMIVGSSTRSRARIFYPEATSQYVWLRHVNSSGVTSASWIRSAGPITPDLVDAAQLAPGAAGAAAKNSLGTSLAGSVNAGAGITTLLICEWKCTSNTTGVTVTLGSKSQTFDFKDQQPFTMISMESGGGSFSVSKSGGGTVSGAELVAITLG